MTRGSPIFVLTDSALLVLVLLALLTLGQWDLPLLCLTSSPLPCLHDHFEYTRLVEIGTEKTPLLQKHNLVSHSSPSCLPQALPGGNCWTSPCLLEKSVSLFNYGLIYLWLRSCTPLPSTQPVCNVTVCQCSPPCFLLQKRLRIFSWPFAESHGLAWKGWSLAAQVGVGSCQPGVLLIWKIYCLANSVYVCLFLIRKRKSTRGIFTYFRSASWVTLPWKESVTTLDRYSYERQSYSCVCRTVAWCWRAALSGPG